jgi:hypothetical protein
MCSLSSVAVTRTRAARSSCARPWARARRNRFRTRLTRRANSSIQQFLWLRQIRAGRPTKLPRACRSPRRATSTVSSLAGQTSSSSRPRKRPARPRRRAASQRRRAASQRRRAARQRSRAPRSRRRPATWRRRPSRQRPRCEMTFLGISGLSRANGLLFLQDVFFRCASPCRGYHWRCHWWRSLLIAQHDYHVHLAPPTHSPS